MTIRQLNRFCRVWFEFDSDLREEKHVVRRLVVVWSPRAQSTAELQCVIQCVTLKPVDAIRITGLSNESAFKTLAQLDTGKYFHTFEKLERPNPLHALNLESAHDCGGRETSTPLSVVIQRIVLIHVDSCFHVPELSNTVNDQDFNYVNGWEHTKNAVNGHAPLRRRFYARNLLVVSRLFQRP